MFDSFIDAISSEISELKKSRKKKYINVEYYKELSQFTSNYLIYEIYVSEYVSKMAEDLSIELVARNHKLDVTIIGIDENQIIKIKTKEKLTEEIYRINMEFDPSFLLVNLSNCLDKVKNTKNSIVNNLKTKITTNEKIKIDTDNLEFEELNESQIRAIKHTETNQVSLIWGPPGTGKTHTLSKIIYRAFLRDEKVLVLSTSNVALDQVLLKLDKNIYDDEKEYIVRLGNTNNKIIYNYTTDHKNYKEKEKNIVFSTLANLSMKYDKLEDFDLVVIDEVSMVSLPYIFIAGNKSRRNIVLLGDFRQLPPISLNKENNLLQSNIYDYLSISKKIDETRNIPYMSMLDTQYRMTKSISSFVSNLFYNDLLKCGVEQEYENALNFINIDDSRYKDTYFSISDTSYFNPISILLVDSLIQKLGEEKEFLIVSPFRPQQNILNGYFRDRENLNGKSLTVHKAQGSEASIVIFDLTTHMKSNKTSYHHFFRDEITKNLVNVAISRAKEQVYIIASFEMLGQLAKEFVLWKKIIDRIQSNFKIINSTELVLNRNEEKFCMDFSEVKKFTIIDTKCKKDFFKLIKEKESIEMRNYISHKGCIPNLERKGVTFRDLKTSDKLPEMYFIDDRIILNEREKYFSISLEKTSMILHRIALESFISSEDITKSSTFTLNCERCGVGTFQIKKQDNNVIFKCSKCMNTKRIGKKEMLLIRDLYNLKCYECGASVAPREGKKGFYFFGCMNYPHCKGSVSLYDLCE